MKFSPGNNYLDDFAPPKKTALKTLRPKNFCAKISIPQINSIEISLVLFTSRVLDQASFLLSFDAKLSKGWANFKFWFKRRILSVKYHLREGKCDFGPAHFRRGFGFLLGPLFSLGHLFTNFILPFILYIQALPLFCQWFQTSLFTDVFSYIHLKKMSNVNVLW